MGDTNNDPIKKVQIPDVQKNQDDGKNSELSDEQLAKVTGGGASYGSDGSYGS